MTVLSRFFQKPPPPPPSVRARLDALSSAAEELVVATILGADEEALRLAAVELLANGPALRTLAGLAEVVDPTATPPPAPVRQAAQARLASLLDAGTLEVEPFCADGAHWVERLSIVALCANAEHLVTALANIREPARLARLVVESPSSRVRALAAAPIEDREQLKQLLKQVRGKDKSVYKIIKQKCDAYAAEERQVEDAAREANAVCAALEQHSQRAFDPLYAATIDVLSARWRALALRPAVEIEARGNEALQRCRDILAAHERELARAAEDRLAQEQARAAEALARQAAEAAAQQEAAEQALTLERDWAAENAAREADEHARAEQHSAEEQAQREIGVLVRMARDVLQRGNTRKAASFRLTIEQKMAAAPSLPLHLVRAMQQLDDKLNELKQWKDYAVAPKRIELIEEMEALVGAAEDPQELAARIRALQQEWRTINKGIVSDVPTEMERFRRASQAAFEPCRAYFALQASLRRDNLEARKRIVERLTALAPTLTAELADHQRIAAALREAPREFWSHAPVERDAGRQVHTEFDAAMDALRSALNAWYDQNAIGKKLLITQAEQLLTLDDPTPAIEGVKQLQRQWKDSGPVPRDRDQALWSEFRGVCDAVFKRREQAYAEYAATLGAAKSQIAALCDTIEQAASSNPARQDGKAKIAEWRAAFAALGELPRGEAREIQNRFERALAQYEAALTRQVQRDEVDSVGRLLEAARLVRDVERAVERGADAAEQDAAKDAAETFIRSVPRWPRGGQQAVRQALANATATTQVDGDARVAALRALCIRLEISSSTPSPPEDADLRREAQLRQLMQSMGQGSDAVDRDWDALLLEWIAIRAVSPEVYAKLEPRLLACLAKKPAKASPASPFANHDGRDRHKDRHMGERSDRRPAGDNRGRPERGPRR